jgi:hypothetical protein
MRTTEVDGTYIFDDIPAGYSAGQTISITVLDSVKTFVIPDLTLPPDPQLIDFTIDTKEIIGYHDILLQNTITGLYDIFTQIEITAPYDVLLQKVTEADYDILINIEKTGQHDIYLQKAFTGQYSISSTAIVQKEITGKYNIYVPATVHPFDVFDHPYDIVHINLIAGYTDSNGDWVAETNTEIPIYGHVSDLSLQELRFMNPVLVTTGVRKIALLNNVGLQVGDRIRITELNSEETTWHVQQKQYVPAILQSVININRETFLLKRVI